MTNNDEQQIIGLAATVQALSVVQSIAIKGQFDSNFALPIFYSLVNYNPNTTLAAYNNDINLLGHGLSQLKKLFTDILDRDLTQYILSVITIERKLVNQVKMRQILQNKIQNLRNELKQNIDNSELHKVDIDDRPQLDNLLISHDTVERFASIYKQTASNIKPRIMIKGNHQFLKSETSANQIRALLLGALRGAAFFRNYGGKRIDFMLKRKQYLSTINKLY